MDLSKLPKLSKTREQLPPADAATTDPGRRQDIDYGRGYEGVYGTEGPLNFLDIFLAIGMGLLFMFMAGSYFKYLSGSDDVYPAITGTGYVWMKPHANEGQPILPEELSPDNRKAYDARVLGREMLIVSESSVFLLGAGLLIAGVVGVAGHLVFLHLNIRRAAAVIGVIATGLAVGYALWCVAVMLRNGITPVMTMVAVLVAGLSLFMQLSAVRSLIELRPEYAGSAGMAAAGIGGMPTRTTPRPGTSAPMPSASADRIVHHRFAHQTLRKAVFQDPATVIGVLQGAGGNLYLRDLWEATCRAAATDSLSAFSTGLESEMTQVGPYSAAIVTLPPAKERGEATHVGIVLRSYVRQDGAVIERSPLVLYYTLEIDNAGALADGNAALCEWQAGDHIKFADRIPAGYAAFREAMWTKVQKRQDFEDAQAATQ